MNDRPALRPRLLAGLGAALLLTSCSSADGGDHRATGGRVSHWGKDMGAPEASAFMKVAVPESATDRSTAPTTCCTHKQRQASPSARQGGDAELKALITEIYSKLGNSLLQGLTWTDSSVVVPDRARSRSAPGGPTDAPSRTR
ncbi:MULTISPECIES: hypothetical protein [Streptomyces]|uniref:hypothetical protein n=1 Tax=Streptomyces TaxID=1883 RepID=UPI001FD803A1|nr:hypothetical protein [Streptomyces griseolus]